MSNLPDVAGHYDTRRSNLVNAIEIATSDSLRSLLIKALAATDVAFGVYDAYSRALPGVLRYLEEHREDARRLVDAGVALATLRDTPTSQNSPGVVPGTKVIADVARTVVLAQEYDILLRRYFLQQVSTLTGAFDELLAAEEADVIVAAVRRFLSFLVGLSPYGFIVDGARVIQETFEARTAQVRAADSHIRNLEVYHLAILQWSLATQFATDVVGNQSDLSGVSLAASNQKLIARMKEYASSLNRHK